MSTVKERLKEYLAYKNLSQGKFADVCGLSRGFVNNIVNSIQPKTLNKIAIHFEDLNTSWLLTGEGEMLKSDRISVQSCEHSCETPFGCIPYFADLQVSVGKLEAIVKDAQPSGYIDLPNVSATALFPVVGCSMSPEINPRDVIGVSQIESWDIVDPDKVYLIITHEDRMIKRLAIDEGDDSILWCLSPNYPKFRIYKKDIKFIYRVTFCGKLM